MLDNPKVRDNAIEITTSNLLIAGVLTPEDVNSYMASLFRAGNYKIAQHLVYSHALLENYLRIKWNLN